MSLIFAIALIPMLILIAGSIDYGIYTEAEAQLDLAADSAAFHAARIASQLLQQKVDPATAQTEAQLAGQKWFLAQLGTLSQADLGNTPANNFNVSVTPSVHSVSATVTYSGAIITHFGVLLPPNWRIGGTATAVISVPSYVEVLMLLDNSSSMLIAADAASIEAMDELTPCSAQGLKENQPFDLNYSWVYAQGATQTDPPASAYSTTLAPGSNPPVDIPYGYGTFVYLKGQTKPVSAPIFDSTPPTAQVGKCDSRFAGTQFGVSCNYPGFILRNSVSFTGTQAGQCKNNYGGPGSVLAPPNNASIAGVPARQNMPQAPCAFACHTDANNNDYYGLARLNKDTVKLRFDYVLDAADQVAQAMASSANATQLSLGVYGFNGPIVSQNGNPALSGFDKIYPLAHETPTDPADLEATYDLGDAKAAINDPKTGYQPPVTPDQADTDFPLALTDMAAEIAPTDGSGTTTANPEKNLFIVTDGMSDYDIPNPPGGCNSPNVPDGPNCRIMGPIDAAKYCQPIKDKGVKIYVLYTQYLPLPNPFYLDNDAKYVEPVNDNPPILAALQACATTPPPNATTNLYFYKANNSQEIGKALTNMLAAALGSPGRISE